VASASTELNTLANYEEAHSRNWMGLSLVRIRPRPPAPKAADGNVGLNK
jgi:hypothetical protein